GRNEKLVKRPVSPISRREGCGPSSGYQQRIGGSAHMRRFYIKPNALVTRSEIRFTSFMLEFLGYPTLSEGDLDDDSKSGLSCNGFTLAVERSRSCRQTV